MVFPLIIYWALALKHTFALKYDEEHVLWNLNENQSAVNPLHYWGEWDNHSYAPSPENWRFPFYTLFLDRFVNGDPSNDHANGTAWEQDHYGTQLRHGGDIKGLQDTLDYIVGMGFRGIYIAGSPFINFPWGADAFSPLDFTLLDPHFATIDAWRQCIDEMHSRGMYIILDNTMSTMGDLIGFEGSLNVSTPLRYQEYNALWKTPRRYHDFEIDNDELDKCDTPYPRFWDDHGDRVTANGSERLIGCRQSEFDQYGDIAAFDIYPEWQRQISKFASVQDRLREWKPSVREKIQHMSCMQISMLDIDGFRMDKGQQITVDAQGEFADHIRQCARRYGKTNFFIPGEIVSGNAFGAIYLGRGKEPSQAVNDTTKAVQLTRDNADDSLFLREKGKNAFDAACFHYSTYRALTRFLGMDGNLGANGETPTDFIEAWNDFVKTNDLINANTGVFDPRHMYGAQNPDVFRWPTIIDGTRKQILGNFITTLLLPGIPLIEWGEEQAFYVLDNTAANYVFGRQAMSASNAWQAHGCYNVGNAKYATWPPGSYSQGCKDDWNSLDHRDPAHPVRNIMATMFELRQRYPVLNDGFYIETLSKQTHPIYLPGSMGTPTETGLWSVRRSGWPDVQDFTTQGQKSQNVWLLFHNTDKDTTYLFDCTNSTRGLLAPFNGAAKVRNLLYPFDEITLESTPQKLTLDKTTKVDGCVPSISLQAWGYKAYVPSKEWIRPSPVITKFNPGHDHRFLSNDTLLQTVGIELIFSDEMDCEKLFDAIKCDSTTEAGKIAFVDKRSFICKQELDDTANTSPYTGIITGQIPGVWKVSANLVNVVDGVHTLTVGNVTTKSGDAWTNAVNHFLLRVGKQDNPIVFPRAGNYSDSLLYKDNQDRLYIRHAAAGADMFRYSLNWGSSWSDWQSYKGGNSTLERQPWSGTKEQAWKGQHVQVEYWSKKAGALSIQQGSSAGSTKAPRRFPHVFLHGSWNQYGYDSGLDHKMEQDRNGLWHYDFMTEWPSEYQVNIWGSNPDGQPDLSRAYGDVDLDGVLDFLSPVSLLKNVVNVTAYPPTRNVGYRIQVNDADLRYTATPIGSSSIQIALFVLLAIMPIVMAIFCVLGYRRSFYDIKLNKIGKREEHHLLPFAMKEKLHVSHWSNANIWSATKKQQAADEHVKAAPRRKVILIATMEYDIEDWDIKIKIGGLGVMSQLMGQHLDHLDLIWVVPCAGDIQYPVDQRAKPITCTILGTEHIVQVQYHHLKNVTYVLLDAPVFRQRTKAEPYPLRMDDINSAVYYSAWNSCIAEVIRRFPVDLYHINDYHGAVAPLHILPRVIPCCLSLHNTEFQGLWPIRTPSEFEEVCQVYNLQPDLVKQYVQFGEVFNLLHAGASYLRVHQSGYGAAGVSKKYGKRSFARYPVLWGLKKVMSLPNPDPTDVDISSTQVASQDIIVDELFEAGRGENKRQAQEWANLRQDPQAELFVFVGRWCHQKGVDLIADVFPAVLEEHSTVQLICVGPIIDLYGKFAALKLLKLMEMYPNRVFSKPEFTALPSYIFSGAEFALIPSRDEPFGLVAVEFGRKGALGVGARVGGLGNMPGWWYTVEATTSKHLIKQFKVAIESSLSSKTPTRAMMRAQSAKQRFPVAKWKEDLSVMQDTAIKMSKKCAAKDKLTPSQSATNLASTWHNSHRNTQQLPTLDQSGPTSHATSPPNEVTRHLSMGSRLGPGHKDDGRVRGRKRLRKPRPGSSEASIRSPSRIRSMFPTSRRSSRESSPTPDAAKGKQTVPRKSVPQLPPPMAIHQPRGVSRITENLDEDHNTANEEELQQFDFTIGQRLDDRASTSSLHEESETESSAGGVTPDEYVLTEEQVANEKEKHRVAMIHQKLEIHATNGIEEGSSRAPLPTAWSSRDDSPSIPGTPRAEDRLMLVSSNGSQTPDQETEASHPYLSMGGVTQGKKDLNLQNVEPFFNDPTGLYHQAFERKIQKLNGKNSETSLCIEDYLIESERDWYNRFRNVKLGKSPASSRASSAFRFERRGQESSPLAADPHRSSSISDEGDAQFMLQEDYMPPTGMRYLLQRKIGTWPFYTFLLAFGQIISANSYQITLLTGEVGQAAVKLYIIATIYLVFSIFWWLLFRKVQSVYVLSLPFLFYGLAFFILGLAPLAHTTLSRGWVQNLATALYAAASSSGAFFFSLNFGSEGSVPVATWSLRAALIQGTQQIYITLLWYWGSSLTRLTVRSIRTTHLIAYGPGLTAITTPLALLMFAIGISLYLGLPSYYRQQPGHIPSFYRTLTRRRIVVWFMISVLLQNYFLSAPYGRNWTYLWSSQHAPQWAIALLVLLFFVGVWAAFLAVFAHLSKTHTWILPIFAVGLGAPRWCQMLWATSNMGQWVPWAGSPLAGALVGRSLWLWLGTLDTVQGVGIGMMLLMTLTRFHVTFVLVAAQVLGSVATIVARASAPDATGPGTVFPNLALSLVGLREAWFWIALVCQGAVCVGFLWWFRGEQLMKP